MRDEDESFLNERKWCMRKNEFLIEERKLLRRKEEGNELEGEKTKRGNDTVITETSVLLNSWFKKK